ncbi:MAG: hypothetical protein V1740_00795 [Candidatus Woesearchaeota archaeon]
MPKKGQAAMEFLMTYGWAILVVLVAIGALAYFGVLNPSRFLPSSCTLIPGLSCDEFRVTSGAAGTSNVVLQIRNGMGDSVDLSAMYIDVDGVGGFLDGSDCGSASAQVDPAAIADGALSPTITFDDCPAITQDARFRADIRATYKKGSGNLTHGLAGLITTKAE